MYKISKKLKYIFKSTQKGMTLIELMVVIAIFITLTGITIFDYSSFRSAVSTDNLANDIALSIRKAQSYAIGVRGISSSSSFKDGYGISFVTTDPGSNSLSGSNKSFIIFADVNNTSGEINRYNFPSSGGVCGSPTVNNECKEILSINGSDKISEIYLNETKQTSNNGRLDIVFRRPNPDALFCHRADGYNSSCTGSGSTSFIKIVVSNGQPSPKEITRTITVWNTGQIGIK